MDGRGGRLAAVVVVAIDGCAVLAGGSNYLPEARFLERFGKRHVILTNDSTHVL